MTDLGHDTPVRHRSDGNQTGRDVNSLLDVLASAVASAAQLHKDFISRRDLDLNHVYQRAVRLDRILADVRYLSQDIARDLDRDLAHGIDLDLKRDRASNRFDRSLASDFARGLDLARILEHDLGFDRARALDRARDRATARADWLVRGLQRAHEKALDLHKVSRTVETAPVQQHPAVSVALSAHRLLVAAAWLLPPADRARYAEEYRSELWEIACLNARRREQIIYALRQVTRAAPLRGAVLAPRKRRVSP